MNFWDDGGKGVEMELFGVSDASSVRMICHGRMSCCECQRIMRRVMRSGVDSTAM